MGCVGDLTARGFCCDGLEFANWKSGYDFCFCCFILRAQTQAVAVRIRAKPIPKRAGIAAEIEHYWLI